MSKEPFEYASIPTRLLETCAERPPRGGILQYALRLVRPRSPSAQSPSAQRSVAEAKGPRGHGEYLPKAE